MISRPPDAPPKIRKHLSASALHAALAARFDEISIPPRLQTRQC
ncbi:MAG: hypothetical protein N2C14_12435 [Planctomycetales bacterium]